MNDELVYLDEIARLNKLLDSSRGQCERAQKERDEWKARHDAQAQISSDWKLEFDALKTIADQVHGHLARSLELEKQCNELRELAACAATDAIDGPNPYMDVEAFAKRFGQVVDSYGETGKVDFELCMFRLKLIVEEFEEITKALASGDIVGIIDGAQDLEYVARGTSVAFIGVHNSELARREVHRSNMEKLPNPGGKPTKPEGWVPPQIEAIVIGTFEEVDL